ncbi:MAG: carbohydrate-binding domain-containing protein [Ruminococcaceae bacterium]|nr:carbohydrate-binding domain-containing protein [Oscillospiraceae bacterium]
MKKIIRITALTLAMLLLAFSAFSCTGTNPAEATPQPSSNPTNITLSGNSISTDKKSGVNISETTVTINAPGTYKFTGKLDNGNIIVDLIEKGDIFLVLAGAEITCSDFAPIYCKQAKNLYIYLEKDTTNKITDGNNYVLAEGTDEPDAAIFSHDDLFIMGEGTLIVDANYNDGITGKDDVNIESGKIVVDAVNHGIKGKDSLEIKGGNIEITANGDGLKSTQDQDATLGFVEIKDGATVKITAGDEGIQAFTNVIIKGGNITIDSIDAAIKAEQVIEFKGGTIEINTYDSPFSATKIEKTPEVSVTVNGSKYEFN